MGRITEYFDYMCHPRPLEDRAKEYTHLTITADIRYWRAFYELPWRCDCPRRLRTLNIVIHQKNITAFCFKCGRYLKHLNNRECKRLGIDKKALLAKGRA